VEKFGSLVTATSRKNELRMDSEEERLRRIIKERQAALTEKVNSLKQRFARIQRLADMKSQVERHPGRMFAGAVLAGFMLKKFVAGKSRRHARNTAYSTDAMSRSSGSGRLWNALIAVISAVATRTAIEAVSEISKRIAPWGHHAKRKDFQQDA
jgi:hypothetical protein